jgi:hypothetical protein
MEIISIKKELEAKVLVENCIENFDFLKVKMVMDFLNWQWAKFRDVPKISDMKDWVRELSNSCLKQMSMNPKQKKNTSASGGFEVVVTRTYEGCEPDNIEIKFILESWDQQAIEEPLK